jgi:hypothetical protein
MMHALNDLAFTQPRWENAAKGYDRDLSGWPEYNGGIEFPRRVHLRMGQWYYRFANSKTPREQVQLGGGWWIEYETLHAISNFARDHSTPRDAVRYLLAVPWDWNECDKLVSAILEKPLDAFRGKGKPAISKLPGMHPNDGYTRYIPPGHLEIMQLYIPDLSSVRAIAFPAPNIEDVWNAPIFNR